MDNTEKTARQNAAKSDMARVRKDSERRWGHRGYLAIYGTKRGVVELSFLHGEYKLTNFNTGTVIAKGGAGVVRPVLEDVYIVEKSDDEKRLTLAIAIATALPEEEAAS